MTPVSLTARPRGLTVASEALHGLPSRPGLCGITADFSPLTPSIPRWSLGLVTIAAAHEAQGHPRISTDGALGLELSCPGNPRLPAFSQPRSLLVAAQWPWPLCTCTATPCPPLSGSTMLSALLFLAPATFLPTVSLSLIDKTRNTFYPFALEN